MKPKYSQLLFLTVMLLFLSCNKDEKNDVLDTPSKFTYDGKEYPIDKGYIHLQVGTRFTVSLFSSGIAVDTSNDYLLLNGRGNGLILSLDSSTPTELAAATYKWPSQTTPGSEMISDAELGITRENTTSINGTFINATSGTGSVTVSKSNTQYTIGFSLLIDGKIAAGQYIGTLANY